MSKLLWHSNSPWTPTGYGQQSGLFTPLLAKHYDLAISSFWGLEGAPIRWEDIPIFPGLGGEFGNACLIEHATRFFGRPRDGIVMTLMDVWVLNPMMARELNMACWVPVDHEPAPPKVVEFFIQSGAIPIAMSRFGEAMLGRLDPLYVPHAVDTDAYQPIDKRTVRQASFPKDAFVVGMVAANKGRPSRKGFAQALQAFSRFAATHPDTFLYLHTVLDQSIGEGENLQALITSLGIEPDRVRIADQYSLLHNPYSSQDMAKIYSAMDVLLNPAWGEGFGITPLEAQACGVPAVVTDHSAMPEVCGAGWHVKNTPHWTNLGAWQAIPDVDDIVAALEECHGLSGVQRTKLSQTARKHALGYDVHRVMKQYMLPALRAVEQRFDAQQPVRIAPRPKVAA